MTLNSYFQVKLYDLPEKWPINMSQYWTIQIPSFNDILNSCLWIVGVYIIMEAGIMLKESFSWNLAKLFMLISALINFVFLYYLPNSEYYLRIMILTNVMAAFLLLSGIFSKCSYIDNLIIIAIFDDSSRRPYDKINEWSMIFFIAVKGIFLNYKEMYYTYTLPDYIMAICIPVIIFSTGILCLKNYWYLKTVDRKCRKVSSNNRKVYFLLPYMLPKMKSQCIFINYYDYTPTDETRKILEEQGIFYVSPIAFKKYFSALVNKTDTYSCICVIYGHEDDYKDNSIKAAEDTIKNIQGILRKDILLFCVIYSTDPDYSYKYLTGSYKKVVHYLDDSVISALKVHDLMSNEILKDIIDICGNEAQNKCYSQMFGSVKKLLQLQNSVYFSWIQEELDEKEYEYDNTKIFYSVLKTLEYMVHLFLIINVAVLFDTDEYEEVINKSLENASLGKWLNLLTSNSKRLNHNKLLHCWKKIKADKLEADSINKLYSFIGIRQNKTAIYIYDIVEAVIVFRNRTYGHGVITPYFIDKEINLNIISILKYFIKFFLENCNMLVEYEGNIYLNYEGIGYDLSEFTYYEAGEFFLLNATAYGEKEFLSYRYGHILKNRKLTIDLEG